MTEEKTLRERISKLENNHRDMMQILMDNNRNITDELTNTNSLIKDLGVKVDKMYPIVREVMQVKGYGSFTWKSLKWIGGVTIAIIALWDKIKHFTHYLFS